MRICFGELRGGVGRFVAVILAPHGLGNRGFSQRRDCRKGEDVSAVTIGVTGLGSRRLTLTP